MEPEWTIRHAVVEDAGACAAIYARYVTDSVITFEVDPPSVEEMATRITAALASHAWIVLEDGSDVLGYAYAHRFAERAAYRWACETSIYLQMGLRRTGAGRALYEVLFARLAARGFRRAVAGMTLPNDASVGLHRSVGFEPVGVYRDIGWKHDSWHDVAWVQRTILADSDPPT
jgi:L-amino acid N-acyltransferase YncA